DREEVGRFVAGKLGIDEVHCELMPTDKVDYVKQFSREGAAESKLAFVGDGINDAPVLALADVGIAMGGLGSDAAIEAADVVLMDDKPSKIAQAIRIARRTIGIAKQNAWFAIGVKVIILLLVATGLLASWAMGIAVFGDVGVMVLAVINAMRAMRT
ncbi:HAD-IC family P-type ATPase, partial [Hallella bergensis]